MMLKKLVNNPRIFLTVVAKRSLNIQSIDHNLGDRMKMLNDNKQYLQTLELIDKHINNIEKCSNWTIIQTLKACSELRDIQRDSNIHNVVSSRLKHDPYILPSLTHFYSYIRNNQAKKAIDLFSEINNPDKIIINLLFNACAQLGTTKELNLIKKVLSNISESFHSDPFIQTSLIDALMKCGDTNYAQLLFDKIKTKNLYIYGAMMKGFIKNNMAIKAIDIFHKIKNPDRVIYLLLFSACAQIATEEALNLTKKISSNISQVFLSDSSLLTSLIDALMMCGDIKTAKSLFEKSKMKTMSMYSVMMKGYVVNNMATKAIDIYNNIRKDEYQRENNHSKISDLFNVIENDYSQSDITIYLWLIKALSQIAIFSISQTFVKHIPNCYLRNNRIRNSLINMWGKTGSIDQAERIFNNISQFDHVGYTAMINAYGLNGMGMQAVELFRKMPKEFIDESAYVCVLNACSHSGLVDVARSIFNNISMKTDFIYTTMIDCLSRAAMFEEAQQLIDEFEYHHAPVWSMYNQLFEYHNQNVSTRLIIDYLGLIKIFIQ
ncbi:unnamed protein product [Rotaria sp. Silwood1]|nr:unnamed protein product [Rotaria sp. Silwood1]